MLMAKIENHQEKVKKYLDIPLCPLISKNWLCFLKPWSINQPCLGFRAVCFEFPAEDRDWGLFCTFNTYRGDR